MGNPARGQVKGGKMTNNQKLVIAAQALRDIINPIGRMKRTMKPGYDLDALWAVRLSDDPNYLKGIAKDALRDIGAS
jgi:hypothetical protein